MPMATDTRTDGILQQQPGTTPLARPPATSGRLDARRVATLAATLDAVTINAIVVGDATSEFLQGGAGNDSIDAGAGDDTLDGGAGVDTLVGGLGNDIYVVDSTTDVIIEAAGAGIDLIQSSVSYSLAALANVERLILSGSANLDATGNGLDNLLQGNAGANVLSAGAGNDQLNGLGGIDTLIGGLGNDIYFVDTQTDVITENAAEGTDRVQSSVSYTLAGVANVENLTLTGTAAIDGTGNTLANTLVGNAANNLLSGLDGNDTFNGGAGVDTLVGGLGNDVYVVDSQTDVITEGVGAGSDLVQSSVSYSMAALANVERLILSGTANIDGSGNALDNVLQGNAGANVLSGGDGNDTFNGGTGVDTLVGGLGNDVYIVDSQTDTIAELAAQGTDQVQSSVTYSLAALANVEILTLTGAAAIDGTGSSVANTLVGNTGNNRLGGLDGNDTLNGGAGVDTLVGGLGNDTYVVDSQTDVIIELAGEGTDVIQTGITYSMAAVAHVEGLRLIGLAAISGTGNALANALTGNAGDNQLTGLEGNDTFNGGAGVDTLVGGLGNDVYVVDSQTDVIIEAVAEGTDSIQSSISYSMAALANVERLILSGTASIDATGNALANVLQGNAGANVLSGGDGNDQLNGLGGIDTLVGGLGNDVYTVDSQTDTITELAGQGTDQIQASVSYSMAAAAHVENLALTGVSAINGSGNALANSLVGNAASNRLDGLDGNDTLNGGTGVDTLVGGLGNDVYVVDSTTDIVTELAGQGTDTIQSSVSYTLAALDQVERLVLSGTASIDATGNALDNLLQGNAGANVLSGAGGNDQLNGLGGIDTLIGGLGNDVYGVDSQTDTITELAGQGTDLIQASVTYSMAAVAEVENLALVGTAAINGMGNSLANSLTGNTAANQLDGLGGNDTLTGGAGIDTLVGGLGDDVYLVDSTTDLIIELAGQGTDMVQSSVSYSMAAVANVEHLVLTGTTAASASGNTLANNLTGNDGNNQLSGLDGDDTLVGAAGLDTLIGGLGNDVYVVDSTTDVITELAGQGTDMIQSSVSYSMATVANVERLILSGTASIDATGNALDNLVQGNTGSNVLSGGDGNDQLNGLGGVDTLVGGAGNDVYTVDSQTDTITEIAGEGTDQIQASVTYSMAAVAQVEILLLTGTAAINGTGNSLANNLTGNAANNQLSGLDGNDTLVGGAGVDTLIGGLGNDAYVVDSTTDLITELAGQGADLIQSSVSYSMAAVAQVEYLILSGTASINGTGNTLDNVLQGNAGANTLDGGAGVDALRGGLGNDVLIGGLGDDFFLFDTPLDGTSNVDTVADYTAGDHLQLSAAIFTGLSTGALAADHYFSGAGVTGSTSAAQGVGMYYDTSTGNLYYDADGFGTAVGVRFANITGSPALVASSFVVGA